MTEPAAEMDVPLLFEWRSAKGEKFLISIFLAGSLVVHAMAFYLFRIIYPPAIAVLPPPARLNLIGSTSEEGRTLLRWIEAEDPALASATVRPGETRTRGLPKLQHIPSYMVQEPKLKEAPPENARPVVAEAFPPGPAPITSQPETAWPKIATHAAFSDQLAEVGSPSLAPSHFTSSTGESPENVRFRVGVNQIGEIRYCLRLNSSGDPSLDEQARLWVVQTRFNKPAAMNDPDDRLVWGIATVEWGNDVVQPARQSTPASP
jgi:hypothetical protein